MKGSPRRQVPKGAPGSEIENPLCRRQPGSPVSLNLSPQNQLTPCPSRFVKRTGPEPGAKRAAGGRRPSPGQPESRLSRALLEILVSSRLPPRGAEVEASPEHEGFRVGRGGWRAGRRGGGCRLLTSVPRVPRRRAGAPRLLRQHQGGRGLPVSGAQIL